MAFDLTSDIKALLTGIVSDIYSEIPADKDIALAIIRSGGPDPEHTFGANTKPAFIHPSFQIRFVHPNKTLMDGIWDSIINVLNGKTDYTPTGTSRTYLFISQQGDIIPLGRDDNRRHIEVLNFNTTIINAR